MGAYTLNKPVYADLVAKIIKEHGQSEVFLFPGGTIAPLMEGLEKLNIPLICTRHEQAAGYAALAKAKITGKAQAVLVSSGPGVTNIVTAIADAYYDSVPLVFFTGQVGVKDMRRNPKHRQRGFQEVDTARMLAPISKQVFILKNPADAQIMTELAFRIAETGRQGPVIVDFPMSSQLAEVDKVSILPDLPKANIRTLDLEIDRFINQILSALEASKRPLLLVGNGVRLADAQAEVRKFAQLTQIPYTQSLPALGTLPSRVNSTSASLGFHGHTGMQYAGLAMHNADFCLILGSRLDVRQTGTLVDDFMPNAKIFRIEIDEAEIRGRRINKGSILHADMKPIMVKILAAMKDKTYPDWTIWQTEIAKYKRQNPLPMGNPNKLSAQRIVAAVDAETSAIAVTVTTGVGSHQQWAARHFSYDTPKRRWLTSAGLGAMGYDLPAAIGAAFTEPDRTIICFVGDGSIQMNIQELATIAEYNLPIKIFCLDNKRFGIVSQFQKIKWQRDLACGDKKNPDFCKIAEGYGIPAIRLEEANDIESCLKAVFAKKGPVLIHCLIDSDQDVLPMLLAGERMDNMHKG